MDTLTPLRINDNEYSHYEDLDPGVLADKFLYSNSSDTVILVKRPGSLFQDIILANDAETINFIIQKHQNVPNPNYSKILNLIMPEEEVGQENFLFASEYGKFSLNFLIYTKKVKLDEKIVMYYFKELASVVESLCQRQIYYYTLKLDDIFFDCKFALKLEEYSIGHLIQSGTDMVTWINRINTKSGSLAPELIKSGETSSEFTVIYNLGFILFTLVVKQPPYVKYEDKNYMMIRNGEEKDYWKVFDRGSQLNEHFKGLVFSMLNENPLERPCFGKIFSNPWFASLNISESYVEEYMKKLEQSFSKTMKKAVRNFDRNINLLSREKSITNKLIPSISKISSLSKRNDSLEKKQSSIYDFVTILDKKSESKLEIEKPNKEISMNLTLSTVLSKVFSETKSIPNDYLDSENPEIKIYFGERSSTGSGGYETTNSDNGKDEMVGILSEGGKVDFNIIFNKKIEDVVDKFMNYFLDINFKTLFISESLIKMKENVSHRRDASEVNNILYYNLNIPESVFEVRFREKKSESSTFVVAEFINYGFANEEFETLFDEFYKDL